MITHGNMIASIAGLQTQYEEVCQFNIELKITPLQLISSHRIVPWQESMTM